MYYILDILIHTLFFHPSKTHMDHTQFQDLDRLRHPWALENGPMSQLRSSIVRTLCVLLLKNNGKPLDIHI